MTAALFAGPGEIQTRCRSLDWAATPLGPVEGWPQSLRTAVSLCLASGFPMLVMWGPELVQVYNDAFRSVLQAKHPAGLGQRARDCWPELWEMIGPMYQGVLDTGMSVFLEDQLFTPERRGEPGAGEEAYFTFSYRAIPDEAHRPAGILATVFETTRHVRSRGEREAALERANAELRAAAAERERLLVESETARAAVAASEARFRAVQEAWPQGFGLYRPVRDAAGRVVDFRIPFVNVAGARLAGRSVAAIQAGTMRTLWPATEAEGIFGDLVRVLETGEPSSRELPYERDGVIASGLAITAVRIGTGEEAEVAVTFADITERFRAEAERARLLDLERRARAESEDAWRVAAAKERRLAAVVAHLPVGVTFAEAPAGEHSISNPAAVAIWGLMPASPGIDAYSRDFVGFWPGRGARGSAEEEARRVASHEWPLARALTAGEVVLDELVEIERPDGTRRLVSLSAAPVRDADGRVEGALVTTVDVTERERLLADAQAARADAEAANRAKSEFLAVMSHELRTPLNAIGGYAELIELGIHGPVTEAQRSALARIQTSQRHLLGLIAGVLDYSRVEAGAVAYRLVDVPVADAVAEAETLVAPQLRAKGLGYAWSGAPPGLCVRADREKLQQILLNLLGNAVKFTEAREGRPGCIEVACSVAALPDDVQGGGACPVVHLHVRDTGAGIAPEQLERVFEPFVQADQRLTRPQQGVGLGLAISRDLARGMGGDLTVESTPGVGSTFTLTLPRV